MEIMEINGKIILHVENFINKTRHLPGVNFRFIFGRYSKHFGFEPHIFQKDKYDEIKSFLDTCVSWENETNCEKTCKKCETKCEKICEKICENLILSSNGSYDLLITNSLNSGTAVNILGIQKIISFKKNQHRFVLSTIRTELNETYYTFEIIAYIPLNYTSKYISDSSLLKVRDIIAMLNPGLELQFEIIK